MAGGGGGDKTESATPKRRRDERKKGNVLLSKDACTVATLFTTTAVLWSLGGFFFGELESAFLYWFTLASYGDGDFVTEEGSELFIQYLTTYGTVVFPPMIVTAVMSVGITMYQTKGLVAFEKIKPKFSKLNPLEGIKNLFSLNSLMEAFKNIVKITILLAIIYNIFAKTVLSFANFLYMDPMVSGAEIASNAYYMIMQIAFAFLAIAGIDFIYQWWSYEKKLKMSKQEIKDEYKQMEGDPQIKGKIRAMQRQMAQSRMMQNVGQADVVVRNPTHFAVALRYRFGEDDAPIVLAKGQDHLAMRIVELAEGHNIPIVEDIPVARALYSMGEVNNPIPGELYHVVAGILSYIIDVDKLKRD